jgi:2-polyprenyl-3-methyl-5-hydroxy-6-metoxy-1,4-benzoquinol methylase
LTSMGELDDVLSVTDYLLSNAWEHERRRLEALENTADPQTIRHLEAIGVARGWKCLEVGGGGGSIARWLSERVGVEGRVVVTDIDPRFIEALASPNTEVLRHDITEADPPAADFDVVHARAVLMHLTTRVQVLDRLARSVKPGGWLLIEDSDSFSLSAAGPPSPFTALMAAVTTKTTIDWQWARSVPSRFSALGLVNVQGEAVTPFVQGGSTLAEFWSLTFRHRRSAYIESGVTTAEQIDKALAFLADPRSWSPSSARISVRGQRPSVPLG